MNKVINCKAFGTLPVTTSFATTGYLQNKYNIILPSKNFLASTASAVCVFAGCEQCWYRTFDVNEDTALA